MFSRQTSSQLVQEEYRQLQGIVAEVCVCVCVYLYVCMCVRANPAMHGSNVDQQLRATTCVLMRKDTLKAATSLPVHIKSGKHLAAGAFLNHS